MFRFLLRRRTWRLGAYLSQRILFEPASVPSDKPVNVFFERGVSQSAKFWALSRGPEEFTVSERTESVEDGEIHQVFRFSLVPELPRQCPRVPIYGNITIWFRMSVVRIGLSIDRETLRELDEARGDVPRSRFVSRLIEKAIQEKGGSFGGSRPDVAPGRPRSPPEGS